jgi:hypothetical protein
VILTLSIIVGSNSLAETYAESAERMVDLQSEVVSMITATFTLENYAEALEAAKSPDHIKIQVVARVRDADRNLG